MFKATKIKEFLKGNIKIPQFDHVVANKARDFQKQLTKPEGSLGKLGSCYLDGRLAKNY